MYLHTKDQLAQLVITPWKEAISWAMIMSGNINLVIEWLHVVPNLVHVHVFRDT